MILVYSIHNIFQYFLPIYVMAAMWLGMGIEGLSELAARRQHWLENRHKLVFAEGFGRMIVGLLLLGLPIYLVIRDFTVLDRSKDYSAYHYANYLQATLPKDAIVLADFWAWAPLAYYQTIGGWRPDVTIRGALSEPGLDWETLAADVREQGRPVYIAAGLHFPPAVFDHFKIHPIAINAVETMPVFKIPSPLFKDVWLPMMDVVRVVDDLPELAVEDVPLAHRLQNTRFGDHLYLVGFGGVQDSVANGSIMSLNYYWVLDKETSSNYFVSVRFEDEQGYIATVRDLPIWDHSHPIGGLHQTSQWLPHVVMCESYDMIVPWRVKPGKYTVRIWVYEDQERSKPVWAMDMPHPQEGIVVGQIIVQAR